MPHNLQILLKTAQLMQDLLSHDPFSRQLVTVSHSSCAQASKPPVQGINRAQLLLKMVTMHWTVSQKKVG